MMYLHIIINADDWNTKSFWVFNLLTNNTISFWLWLIFVFHIADFVICLVIHTNNFTHLYRYITCAFYKHFSHENLKRIWLEQHSKIKYPRNTLNHQVLKWFYYGKPWLTKGWDIYKDFCYINLFTAFGINWKTLSCHDTCHFLKDWFLFFLFG